MENIKYVIKRLTDMNYKALLEKLNSLHKKTGRSRIALLRDMQKCAVNYGAGYMDYDLFEMYNLTDEQRDTYLTRGRNNALIVKYNDPAYYHCFDNKDEFNTNFGEYIHREWIPFQGSEKGKVLDFISRHKEFIAKPIEGSCGKGIEKIRTADYENPQAVYDALAALNIPFELEEVVLQHPAVSAIYPYAINTVRIVTIYKEEKVHIICAYFRIGNHGNYVDNFNSGGMTAPVDERTGTVKDKAIDKNKNLYEAHPQTGAPIKGFQFPNWDKALDMVCKAAKEIPQMAYIGWDVAFAPDGPLLIEGNNFPGHDIYQLPEHTPDKIGMMSKFNV